MLEVYTTGAERRDLYRKKVPGIMARLQAAELIAKRTGLIKDNFFSISSGLFSWQYRRNLVIMKIISHALFRLEYDGWLKVYPDRVYIVAKKGPKEEHNIFGVISEVASQISDVMGDNVKKTAEQIRDKCGCYDLRKKDGALANLPSKDCTDIFFLLDHLSGASLAQKAMGSEFASLFDFSPITKAAAKDIVASSFLFERNKEVFEKSAAEMVITGGNPAKNRTRLNEAARFDRYLSEQINRAKAISASDLNAEFSLGPADASPLFKGDEFKTFLNDARKIFDPDAADRASYVASLENRIDPDGKGRQYFDDAKTFLDEFLVVCEMTMLNALNDRKSEIEGLSPLQKKQMHARIKVAIADVMAEFLSAPVSDKLSVYFKSKHDSMTSAEKFFKYYLDSTIAEAASSAVSLILDPFIRRGDISQPYDITYIISDLHLQDYPHRDTFELLRLLHTVVATGGTLIINGDFLDTWRAKNLESVYMSNKTIFDALRMVKRVIIIRGNHDEWLGDISGKRVLSENVSVKGYFWDRQIDVEHGNSSDKFNSQYLWIGRLATKLVNKVETNPVIGPQILTWIEYFAKRIAPEWYWKKQKIERLVNGAIKTFSARNEKGSDYSTQRPLYQVKGHYHSAMLFESFDEVRKRIRQALGGRSILLQTDSWFGNEGFAGVVVAFAKKKDKGTGNLMATSFIWEYPKIKEIITNYENPNF